MSAVVIAILAMVSAQIAVHLGLGEAISEVAAKVLNCPKCFTFWLTLAALTYAGKDPIVAMSLSLIAAYLSNFFGLILFILYKLYNDLWQLINDKLGKSRQL